MQTQKRYVDYDDMNQWFMDSRQQAVDLAMQDLAKGVDPAQVLEKMSCLLINKIMHPIKLAWQDAEVEMYNLDGSRYDYDEYYTKRFAPKADHVEKDQ